MKLLLGGRANADSRQTRGRDGDPDGWRERATWRRRGSCRIRAPTVDAKKEKWGGATAMIVGVRAAATGDDAAADSKGADRQPGLHRSTIRSRDGPAPKGRPRASDAGWIAATALCAREKLRTCVDVLAQEQADHRSCRDPEGCVLPWMLDDHERQRDPGEATDRGQAPDVNPVGHHFGEAPL